MLQGMLELGSALPFKIDIGSIGQLVPGFDESIPFLNLTFSLALASFRSVLRQVDPILFQIGMLFERGLY